MRKIILRKFSFVFIFTIMLFSISGCAKKAVSQNAETKNPVVTIEMEDASKIKIELYPKIAPNTVNNFISLINSGYYDGLIFHRVIPGFMIQGGDPKGSGSGGPGYAIKGEFSENNFKNELKHTRGVISMARTDAPNTAGSQFFIMVADYPSLDGKYAAFGKVTEGIEVADKIVKTLRDSNDKPKVTQKMKKVTVETYGVKYDEPKKIKE
jgi:peptidyl-prolyl cis-trans isomerase B (cyclophilin B)